MAAYPGLKLKAIEDFVRCKSDYERQNAAAEESNGRSRLRREERHGARDDIIVGIADHTSFSRCAWCIRIAAGHFTRVRYRDEISEIPR